MHFVVTNNCQCVMQLYSIPVMQQEAPDNTSVISELLIIYTVTCNMDCTAKTAALKLAGGKYLSY